MSTAEFQNRVEFLNDTVPLDNSPEEAFDRLTRLSTLILGVPIALVSLVESEREFVKSEASVLDSSPSQGILPLSQSVCQLALGSGEPLVVVDARDHPLLRDDPAVAAYDVRAYAGVPLVTPDGRTLGTFCVMDHVPRQWTTNDVNVLKGLAAAAATEIALRNEIRERVRVQQESARLLQALQAEQGRVMALFEQAPAFIAAVNGPEHRFEMANRAYYQLVGLRDLIGKPLAEAIPETVEQGFVAMLDRVLDTGEAFSAAGARVVLQPRCDAEPDERFVDFACQPLTDPDGTRSGILMHGVDVTEQLRATNALRESEERYRLLFDSNPLPMWVYDAETLRFIAVNCSAVSRYGYSRQEFLAMTILDIRPAAAAEAVRVAAGVAGSGETFVPAQQHRFKDGTIIDVDITSRPIALGARACRLVLAVDVTDRRRAEAALRDSEAQLRLAIDVAEMVVWEHDLATGTVSSRAVPRNPDSSHLLAATLGTHDGFLSVVHQDDRERVRRTHEDAVRRAGEFSVEFRVIGLDGVIRWKQTSARVLLDDDGHPVRIIGVSRDVTDRIALEAQLRQAQKMEAVGQLAGGVAHDFNNLLTVITAGITFAREALPRDAAALEELAVVEEAAGKAARLTRQLLAFGRKQMLQPELLDINRIVRGVEPMLRRLIGEDVRIGTVPVAGLFLVFADPGQLEQVIVNLAVNARDAMPDGGTLTIETASVLLTDVEANARGVDAQARYVRLTVRDTGMGMDDATLSRAFEPFFTTKGSGRGTGLGLATVHGIVQQSGGHIQVTSVPGEGTVFEIDLPQVVGIDVGEPPKVVSANSDEVFGTILLVEDEAPVRAIARRILARKGYTVIEASNGREALEVAAENAAKISMVVTDMVMPELGGRAFAEQFTILYPGIPLLFVSGYADDEILRRGPLPPRTTFLEKPFTPDGLLTAVRTVMSAQDSPSAETSLVA
jgi:PAS domain S-box-containing protein